MNKSTLIKILKNDTLLEGHSMESLSDLEKKYPHFSMIKILMAKKARMTGSSRMKKIIQNAAVSGAARPHLFRVLNDQLEPEVVEEKEEIEAEELVEQPNSEQETGITSNLDQKNVYMMPPSLSYDEENQLVRDHFSDSKVVFEKPELPEETVTRESVESDLDTLRAQFFEKHEIKKEMSNEEMLELIRGEVMEDLTRLKQSQEKLKEQESGVNLNEEDIKGLEINRELIENLRIKIENFTRKYNIDIKPLKSEDLTNEDVHNLMTSDEDNISEIKRFLQENEQEAPDYEGASAFQPAPEVTETMALLYEKQGAYDKAIDVYEQLKLKYPKKNAYFAYRMEVLRDRS